ncbi:MAG: hypothetical protein Q3979_10180 [Actinomycetaceae bacterium]|nr:hypothetical protein [Actinomycetaceae bacterium]
MARVLSIAAPVLWLAVPALARGTPVFAATASALALAVLALSIATRAVMVRVVLGGHAVDVAATAVSFATGVVPAAPRPTIRTGIAHGGRDHAVEGRGSFHGPLKHVDGGNPQSLFEVAEDEEAGAGGDGEVGSRFGRKDDLAAGTDFDCAIEALGPGCPLTLRRGRHTARRPRRSLARRRRNVLELFVSPHRTYTFLFAAFHS